MDESCTTERGAVLRAEDDALLVRIRRGTDDGCGGCRSCSLNKLCKGGETGHMDLPVKAPEGRAYKPGDELTLAYRQANPALAACILFVPALAGLALGGWIGNAYGNASLLLGCGLGFAAGVGLSWGIARRADALKPRIWIVEEEAETE